jgi:hypothetical protein
MIIEVNGQQVEVDDSFATLSPEKQQETLQYITGAISPQSSVEVRGATEEDLVNPLYGTVGGAFAGQLVGPTVNRGVEAMRSGAPSAPSTPSTPGGASPGQKFAAKTGYGSGTGFTVEEVVEHKKAQEKPIGKGKISSKIASNSPMNVDRMLQLEAAKKAEDARRAAALAPTGLMAKMPEPVQAAGRFLGGAAQSGVTPYLGRAVAGAGAGFQGTDAYNRFQQGDYPGAAISGLGALGSAAAFIPTPVTRIGGPAIGIGAEMLNQYLDSLKKKVEGMDQPAPAPAPAAAPGMAKGGKAGALESIAKKTKGFLESTPTKPNELVGTRFKSTDLGGLIEPTPFDIESALGAKAIHRPYDLSGRNQRIEEISGHKLLNPVITEGGQPFGRDIKLQATGQGGASNKSINDRILKRVEAAAKEGDGQVFNIPSSMTYGSEAFSNMPIDILLDLIKQRELPTDTLKYLSNLVRAKNPNLQKFVGFEHPEVAKQFTEGGFELATTPGKLRIAGTNVLTGKTNKAQELLDYNQEDLFAAIRAPELRDVPPGYMGQTIMEAVPGHPGFKTGSHRAYDSGDASTYRGQGINAPISIWMPDAYKQALAEVRSAPKTAGNALGHQRAMARNVLGTAESGVAQTITPQVADNLQRYQEAISSGKLDAKDLDAIHRYIYGKKAEQYAKGGKVLSAIKKLSEDAQGAYKAKFTPGFYHGSPSNKIKDFDPTKSSKPEEYITPGVTFLTKNPSFAHDYMPIRGTASQMFGQPDQYATGATMYPVSANLGKQFDFDTPEGKALARAFLKEKLIPSQGEKDAARWLAGMQDEHNTWKSLENPDFLQHLKDTGHNSFAVREAGINNIGIFEPKNIRGKFAKYNPEDAESPDFMKAEGGAVHLASGGKVPEKIVKAYKLFKTKGGNTNELYPLFVNANKPVPLNEWVNAEVGPVAASGKVKSKLGELAYRPGWHAGDLPVATHIGGKSAPDLKAPDFRRPDEVWAEVEMPDDVSWQEIANQRARLNKAGKPIASTAHITDQIPEGGFYRYKTSPNMEGNWLIGGGMKVNRVLTDEEVMAINEAAGVADLPRFTKFDEKAEGGSVDGYERGGRVGALEMLAKKLMPLANREANKAKFLESSAVKDRLYHGTTSDISAFDPSTATNKTGNVTSHFGTFLSDNPAEASRYAEQWGTKGGNVMPVYTQLQNPYMMPYREMDNYAMGAWNRRKAEPGYDPNAVVKVGDMDAQRKAAEAYEKHTAAAIQDVLNRKQELMKLGHDGIIANIGGKREIIPFNSSKIKSAIGNEGTYDITNPDITKKNGGSI